MKHSSFFLSALITIVFVNCTKNADTNADINTNDTSLVKTLTVDYTGVSSPSHTIFTFYYDMQKRISQIKTDNINIDFEYSKNLITKKIYPNGQPAQNNYYYFNNNSFLDSTFLTTDSVTTMHAYYQYNAGNEVVQRTEYTINTSGDTIDVHAYKYKYDNKDNPVLISTYFIDGPDSLLSYEDQFIYSDSASIVTSADMMYPDYMQSKNLLSSRYHSSQLPGLSFNEVYSYTFDHFNRLETITAQGDGNFPYTYIKTYTYY